MKFLLSLLLAPVLSLAAATGSVTLLDGTPIAGAVVKSQTDSVTTSATGTFVLGRTSWISSRSAKSISVTSHLVVENGRPRLSFAGMDIAGRVRSPATTRQNPSSTAKSIAARSTGTPDTLKVYWKGKRLTVLPVTSDTTVTFRIDTAWKDDAGIPWNPSITYGSLFDSRDGQTYRSVTIGSQTWMAENLNYRSDSARSHPSDTLHAFGMLYMWIDALHLPDSCMQDSCQESLKIPHHGVCPSTWHIPTSVEWTRLTDTLLDPGYSGYWLGGVGGWWKREQKLDRYGFRALGSGAKIAMGGDYIDLLINAYWWTSSNATSGNAAMIRRINYTDYNSVYTEIRGKSNFYSLRCIKD